MAESPDAGAARHVRAAPPRTPLRGRVYVAMQELRNRPLGRLMRQLEERERLSPEVFERLHLDELREILTYARMHVPRYSSGPWKAALSSGDAGDIRQWPLLTKEMIRQSPGDLRAAPPSQRLMKRRTSGSTGLRIEILSTPEADVWGWAHRYRGLLWHGIPIGVPSLRMTHARRPLRDLVKGERCVPSLESSASIEAALRYLQDEKPGLVTGPPSVLFHLARHLKERGVSAPLVPFARAGGEQCFDFQRREIQARLCSRVIDSYGCNETGPLAGECPAGSLHVYADHVHLEIFAGDEPALPGDLGEIVVTSLRNTAMPLVRYPVGDRGRLTGEPCGCGLPHPVLSDLQARSGDVIGGADGGRHHASELVRRIGSIFAEPASDGIRQFQVTADGEGGWEVCLEAAPGYPDANGGDMRRALETRLSGIVQRFCGETRRVAVHFTTAIPRKSGKLKYLRTAA